MVRDSQVKSSKRSRRTKRFGRKRIFIACIVVFATLGVLYAALPWWAPKRYLADKLARDLATELSLPVSIGSLEMSWSEGVTVSDVRIGNGAGFGADDMVVADTLMCDLSPLQTLWTGRLKWMEITGARLDVVFSRDGRANVASLQPLMEMPPPGRMALRQATATVQFPGHDRRLRLDVADLQYRQGRLEDIRQITMSASLAQDGQGAPVTLTASAGETSEDSSAASGSFRFTGVDISQLKLPRLLALPLKRLSGKASGQMDCRFDHTGRVGQFSLELGIEDLDAQPMEGPALPVIERADFTVTATSDPIYKSIDVRTFGLHVPGIELTGKGHIHADALAGRWEAVRALEVSGLVNPTTVAALLSGRSETLPGRMEFDGNVSVKISLRGDKSQMSFGAAFDATASTIRTGRNIAKPAGRKMTAEIHGNIEKHTWRLRTDPARPAELQIGKNRFTGTGTMRNIRRAPAGMDWHGQWEIVELDSIGDMLACLSAAKSKGLSAGKSTILRRVRLDGAIKGKWYAEQGRIGLRSIILPEGTSLTVGEWFVKPADRSMEMELAATVTTDPPGFDRVRFQAGLSRAQSSEAGDWDLSVEDGRLIFPYADSGKGESSCVWAGGRYGVRGLGELLGCIPSAEESKKRIGGALTGKFSGVLSPSMKRIYLQANATQLKARIGNAFQKTAGQPAEITVDFQSDETLPPSRRNRLAVRAELASAVLDGSLTFPSSDADRHTVRCFGRVQVADAAWLVASVCGAELTRTLRPLDIRGSMVASLRSEINDEFVAGELTCNADDLRFQLQSGDSPGRFKPRGGAFRLRLAGRIDDQNAAINILSLDVGKSNVSVTGNIRLSDNIKTPPAGAYLPVPGLVGGQLNISGRLTPDPTARSLLPELDELVERCGLGGAVRFAAEIKAGEEQINAAGLFDALEMTVSTASVRKAGGERAAGRFDLSIPADLSEIKVRDVFVDTDFFQLRAGATFPLLGGVGYEAHAALSVPDLSRIGVQFPRLVQYRPAGGVFVEGRFTGAGNGADVLEYVTIKADSAAATIARKRCRVDGTVMLEKVTLPDKVYGWFPSLFEWLEEMGTGRVATDSFEFSIGDNHGFIVADLRNPAAAPAGRIAVLCTRLDTYDLERWAGLEVPPPTKAPPAVKDLSRRADNIIARLGRVFSRADLDCRFEVKRMRYFDPKVRAFFEPRGMIANVRVKDGKVRAGYRCGLNGGTMGNAYSLDLNATDARVAIKADLKELLVDKNLLAQIAWEFPGNTIYGTFSQAKEVTYSLRDIAMNAMDVRYNPIRIGTAKTRGVDGMVSGKGAPRFITRFFPGLNLTTYRYRKMTGFAEYLPDGTAENDMIFNGPYDIYMVGTTDAEGIADYTIGVILLSPPQSPEFNHRFRQGRIPILKFKARIADGRFYDEEVSYPWPTETAYRIFLQNNIFYRLWLNANHKPVAAETGGEPEKN